MSVPEPSSDPVPLPPAELQRLRRAVYGPQVDPAVAERYRRLQKQADHDRATEAEPAEAPADATAPPAEPSPRPARRAALPLVAAGIALAFAAGVLVAPALGRAAAPAPTATFGSRVPGTSGIAGTGGALGVFGEPQREGDRPPIPLDTHLLAGSFHRLRSVPARGVTIYAAQDSTGDVCLVALSVDARLAASCMPVPRFRGAPLRLAFAADRYRNENATTGTQVELIATWGFLGRLDLRERPVAGE